MIYVIADLNDNSITINDVPYTKVYDFKIGTDDNKVTLKNVYDSHDVIFRNVDVSNIQIEGVVYETALELMEAFEPLKKKVAEGDGGETPNLQSVLDVGNYANTDIQLGGYQQAGSFISFVTGLFGIGIFSRTTINPSSIVFEENTSKTTLLRESGLEGEVAVYLPYENGTLATKEWINDNIVPYKIYTALVTQEGTNDPVPVVMQNTIGELEFVRDDVGQYKIISSEGKFTANKTVFIIGGPDGADANLLDGVLSTSMSENVPSQIKFFSNTGGGPGADHNMHSRYIEIRVYN